jgi:hypothetical protein
MAKPWVMGRVFLFLWCLLLTAQVHTFPLTHTIAFHAATTTSSTKLLVQPSASLETRDAWAWEQRIEELLMFQTEHGHCRVPSTYQTNPKLARWVVNLRQNYTLSEGYRLVALSQDRMDELTRHGFEWPMRKLKWSDRLEELKAFADQNGHVRVPNLYPENPQLGQWVSNQRTQYRYYKEGKTSTLKEEKVKQLEAVGFQWSPMRKLKWSDRLEELTAFADQNGHVRAPKLYQDNPQLRRWVIKQRTQYRYYKEGRTSTLNEEKVKQLEAVGFQCSPMRTLKWSDRLEELKAFADQNGHVRVPKLYPENPQLGGWVSNQRTQYRYYKEGKTSKLNEEKVKQWEAVGFQRSLKRSLKWSDRLEELKAFADQNGHVRVPKLYPENPQLGRWVINQRTQYRYYKEGKTSKLNEEKVKQLEAVGFQRSLKRSLKWSDRLEELKAFADQNGHVRVPKLYRENQQLGRWVANQRTQDRYYKEGKTSTLNEEKVKQLEAVGFQCSPMRKLN